MDKIIISLNDKVRFKLTDLGRKIYYHQFDDLIAKGVQIRPKYPEEDADGYTSMLLWEFVEIYGQHIGMARQNVIEPLNLIVEEPRLMSCPPEPEDTAPPIRKRQLVKIVRCGDRDDLEDLNNLLAEGWQVSAVSQMQGFSSNRFGVEPYTEYLLKLEDTG